MSRSKQAAIGVPFVLKGRLLSKIALRGDVVRGRASSRHF